MAEADLDVVIRAMAKQQIRTLTAAARKRQGRLMGMAAKAKDIEAKARYRHMAKSTLALAVVAAHRMQLAAENTADSYLRSIRQAAEEKLATKPAKEKPAGKKAAKGSLASKPARKKKA